MSPRLLIAAVLVAWAAGACGGASSSAPHTFGEPSSGASSEPSSGASEPAGSEGPADGFDFSKAAEALNQLDSYAFSVEVTARNTQPGPAAVKEGTTLVSGSLINAPAKASTLHLVTSDKDGVVTDETEIISLETAAYLRSGGANGSWQAIPAAQAATFTQLLDSFRPEQMFALYFVPIGTDNTTVGDENRNGVETTHYRGGEDVGAILGSIAGVQGSWTSDLWIARDGGFLVASEAGVQASDANGGGSFSIVVNITEVNSAGPVEAPI